AQAIQLPSVSGKEINTILFEYARTNEEALGAIIDNFSLVNSAGCDVCILSTADKEFGFMKTIHIWITPNDLANGNLMILMGYVIMGHPDWKKAKIKILCIFPEEEIGEQQGRLISQIKAGRLPISVNNLELIPRKAEISKKELINSYSKDADLTIIGFRSEAIKQMDTEVFRGYDIGNILFINAATQKEIILD
ncbi:MAG: amino acid permease, partial [Cyclobacteriaceae bacterium]|nr:amino acid permease [Cyclobacteriaceae bacterium]